MLSNENAENIHRRFVLAASLPHTNPSFPTPPLLPLSHAPPFSHSHPPHPHPLNPLIHPVLSSHRHSETWDQFVAQFKTFDVGFSITDVLCFCYFLHCSRRKRCVVCGLFLFPFFGLFYRVLLTFDTASNSRRFSEKTVVSELHG